MNRLNQRTARRLVGCLGLLTMQVLWSPCAPAATPAQDAGTPTRASEDLSIRIDRHLASYWRERELAPALLADEATFLRRVSLDLIGRIPTAAEAREFLDDSSGDKAETLVDRLLASPEHARHMAAVWRRAWVPQTDTQQFSRLADDYERWLASRLRDGVGHDQLVAEQLTVPVSRTLVPIDFETPGAASPTFLAVGDLEPEKLAANAARAFLGINLDCAQCHDHPFARWSRDQFWQTAAFFARPKNGRSTVSLEIPVGDSERLVQARFPDGVRPELPLDLDSETGRQLLAEWITAPGNPFFARNLVNRTWAELLGHGLIEPLDDMTAINSSPHAALLDELARALVAGRYQLRPIVRGIVLSRAYRSASAGRHAAQLAEPRSFAAMPVRGLTGQQLLDSILVASGRKHDALATDRRRRFIRDFHMTRAAEARRSPAQALLLMNGAVISRATSAEHTPAIVAVADAPFLNRREKIEAVFLAAYARRPSPEEREGIVEHLERSDDLRSGLADVFWALLNSAEFSTNH